QAFQNLSLLLEASGSSMSKVVKTTVWLCDSNNFAKLNELYTKFFPNNPPARSTPVVGLPLRELHISIECIALI
ncbi:MAG TPA: Rid family hydrolase, partial [Candidatus Marinimicrobia bacterium]|nr:Rid family hydrolase [Candidatus Neomarinimicrobiota bacterium]